MIKRYEVILSDSVTTYVDANRFVVSEDGKRIVFTDQISRAVEGDVLAMFSLDNIIGFKLKE